MKLTAVRIIQFSKHSKIVLPGFLLIFAYFLTAYILFPHPTIPTKVEDATTSTVHGINPSLTMTPTPRLINQTHAAFINSISGTPTAGASSSVTNPTPTVKSIKNN
jgi:hypothetical protein